MQINKQVEQRKQSYKLEHEKTQQIQIEERTALQTKIAGLQLELDTLTNFG